MLEKARMGFNMDNRTALRYGRINQIWTTPIGVECENIQIQLLSELYNTTYCSVDFIYGYPNLSPFGLI
jgi:hypothetical protein